MEKIKILALFGKSSAGKDSIQRWLLQNIQGANGLISYTTRPPRDSERDGRDYCFVSEFYFKKLILEKRLLEYTKFKDWYYGTDLHNPKPHRINIGVFNPTGIRSLLEHSDKFDILPVYIQASDKDRLTRSLKREANPNCAEICRRFLADEEDFKNIDFEHEVFLNDKINDNFYGLLNRPKIREFIKGQN